MGGFGGGNGSGAGTASRGGGTGTSTPAQQRNSTAAVEGYTIGDTPTRPTSTVKPGEEGDSSLTNGTGGDTSGVDDAGREDAVDKMQAYAIPSPRTYFAHFIQHPRHFSRFLETVALARWGQAVDLTYQPPSFSTSDAPAYSASGSQKPTDDAETEMDEVDRALRELGLDPASGVNYDGDYEDQDLLDQKSIWNTLLELYLTSSGAAVNAAKGRDTALKLLQQHESLPYDIPHAVMLCAVEAFNEGLILLYERMGMFEDVVRLHMDSASSSSSSSSSDDDQSGEESSRRVVESLHKYGPIQPELYDLVLRFLISSPILLSRHTSDLLSILTTIRETSLMSTLEIIQLLSSTPYTHVGIIRDFSPPPSPLSFPPPRPIPPPLQTTSFHGRNAHRNCRTNQRRRRTSLPNDPLHRVLRPTRPPQQVHFMCKHSYTKDVWVKRKASVQAAQIIREELGR